MNRSSKAPILLFDVLDTLVVDPLHEVVPAFFGMTLPELWPLFNFELWERFERGTVDEATMLDGLFRDRRRYDRDRFLATLSSSYRFVPGMESLLERLVASGATIHLFSNYPVWYRAIEARLGLSRFARWSFVSCHTGLRKPEPYAYHHAWRTLLVHPGEVLMIDDQPANCAAARMCGMSSLVFKDATSLEAEVMRREFRWSAVPAEPAARW